MVEEVFRVTARKDEWGEVHDYICNECRFEKKKVSDWVIEGPTNINRHSVISANKYKDEKMPHEMLPDVMGGRDPKLMMDIHQISDVNDPDIDLSKIQGAATSETFEKK